jgi:hypothetical protein
MIWPCVSPQAVAVSVAVGAALGVALGGGVGVPVGVGGRVDVLVARIVGEAGVSVGLPGAADVAVGSAPPGAAQPAHTKTSITHHLRTMNRNYGILT